MGKYSAIRFCIVPSCAQVNTVTHKLNISPYCPSCHARMYIHIMDEHRGLLCPKYWQQLHKLLLEENGAPKQGSDQVGRTAPRNCPITLNQTLAIALTPPNPNSSPNSNPPRLYLSPNQPPKPLLIALLSPRCLSSYLIPRLHVWSTSYHTLTQYVAHLTDDNSFSSLQLGDPVTIDQRCQRSFSGV